MATREGRKTPTGSEIDDWFDLLDTETPGSAPKLPGAPTESSKKTPPAEVRSDSWDWDMETPVVPLSPPAEAHPEEEFTDFGGPTPVAAPISAASVSPLPEPGIARRFQGTMMFGATPQAPGDSDLPPAPTAAPPAAPALPAEPPRPVSASPFRQRTPVPRAPVSRSVPLPVETSAPPPRVDPPPVRREVVPSLPKVSATELDELEFEDVEAPTESRELRTATSVSQRSTPAVPVFEVTRAQHTPVVLHSIPAEAQRSPIPPRPPSESRSLTPPSTQREMIDRFELGDFTGALSLAEALLEIDRHDADARRIAETSRTKLRAIYVGRLGALDQVPVMMIPHAELRWLALDHRAGFVLSLVDGTSSIDEIIDVSTMPQLEVLRTLYNLLSQNVISLRRPRR